MNVFLGECVFKSRSINDENNENNENNNFNSTITFPPQRGSDNSSNSDGEDDDTRQNKPTLLSVNNNHRDYSPFEANEEGTLFISIPSINQVKII